MIILVQQNPGLHPHFRRCNFRKLHERKGGRSNTFLFSKVLFCKVMVLDNVQVLTFIVVDSIIKCKESQIFTKMQRKSTSVRSKFD